MHITFSLGWLKKNPSSQGFKFPECRSLLFEYVKRISRFMPCKIESFSLPARTGKRVSVWLCERNGKSVSSEELAKYLNGVIRSGASGLRVVIGGSDGFPTKERELLKPDFVWSFGPLTLPHELAAVVAAEQMYRACTILRNLPYHFGH